MNIIKRFIRICALYTKKRRLKKQLRLYKNTSAGNDLSKTVIAQGADLTLNSKSKDLSQQVLENVKKIVKEANGESKKLLEYIEKNGTNIYRIYNAEKLLKNIGEEEGFIPEKKGIDALYLSLITMSGLKIKTEPMLVLNNLKVDKYLVLFAFYKWFSMKSGLNGFEYEIQKKYNQYLKNISKAKIKNLPLDEIINLQEAIARDKEATDFVLNYEKENEISKKVSEKISQDGGANV